VSRKKLRIGVLFGGQSGEHEVSLASASGIMAAMDPDRYDVIPIGITKDGQWLTAPDIHQRLVTVAAQHPVLQEWTDIKKYRNFFNVAGR
jgi:D-alanine-D-alanine ligase